MSAARCSFCGSPLKQTFVDLGMGPLVSSYLREDQLDAMEPFYPLHVYVCGECFLVQLRESASPEALFGDYPYFSSVSKSWLRHAKSYVEMMVERFGYGADSHVVEIASNDGYLLQYFKERGVPVLGVEPARNIAAAAEKAGIPTVAEFFGRATAGKLAGERQADLLVGNNVLAHVPDLNDFAAGLKTLLAPGGVITLEFPHLLRLMTHNQFDTIFHEHFSYLSFSTVGRIFEKHELRLFDVEELPTHGGSLRVYACHAEDPRGTLESVGALRQREDDAGLSSLEGYAGFAAQAVRTKHALLEFLIRLRRDGRRIAGYGAPGKGCILLNYVGIGPDFLDYTVDLSPHKQGLFMPGVHIPIHAPDKIAETKPDYVLILPWNLKDEIMTQMAHIREWGGRFIIPIPEVEVR